MIESFEIFDESFKEVIKNSMGVTSSATGFTFTEGPVWHNNSLLFSDIPNNRIIKYELLVEGPAISTFRHPSGNSNGITLDLKNNLIVCEHSNRRVTSTDENGNIKEIASIYEGKRLNSPNDVVVKTDGWIYFTDPPYGLPNRSDGKELDFNGVFKVRPDGSNLSLIIKDMTGPNGLAFSPDESILFVSDSLESIIKKYDVNPDGTVSNGSVFADLNVGGEGVPDGIKVDTEGRLYSTGPKGIWVFGLDGKLIGKILIPEIAANCGWGKDGGTLFVTARTSIYSVSLNTIGTQVGIQ